MAAHRQCDIDWLRDHLRLEAHAAVDLSRKHKAAGDRAEAEFWVEYATAVFNLADNRLQLFMLADAILEAHGGLEGIATK